MDYINRYNLSFDFKHQQIFIEHSAHILSINIDSPHKSHKLPVTLSHSLYLPPYGTRTVPVSTPIPSISSSLIPHQIVQRNIAVNTTTLVHFCNYSALIQLSNISPFPQYLKKGFLVALLSSHSHSPSPRSNRQSNSLYATSITGVAAVPRHVLPKSSPRPLPSISSLAPLSTQRSPAQSLPHHVSPPCVPHTNIVKNLSTPITDEHRRQQLFNLLHRFSNLFDTSKHNIATTSIHHVIHTIPHSPPACKPYPQPNKETTMYQLIQEFLHAGLITESHSPYAAPALLVKKSDNTYRFVVDYKKLNLITIKDSSPLPNMEDTLRKLGNGYHFFSRLDLKSGFYQIPIRSTDKEKTAFITTFGLYQFNVLPMGLKNSPPTFQKVMTDTLKSCREFSLVYLDDIIVFSQSFDEHLHDLEKVLLALQTRNFILNPPKCVFASTHIDYLGHTVSFEGITPMKDKIEAILKIKEPRSLAQANKFIGALSWYRKFIPNFATVAAPIRSVINLTKDKRHNFKWKYAQSKAFHELKQLLITQPLFLQFPLENTPLILTTDASAIGIGGVLQQEAHDKVYNLYYHSQLMTPCERKYSTIEKEALATYKCFVRMRPLILGRTITIKTDHCPLCHILEKTVRNPRVELITYLIQEYNIERIVHINGRDNCLPDFLSRYYSDTNDELFEADYGLESKPQSQPLSSSSLQSLHSFSNSSHDNSRVFLAPMVLRSHVKQLQLHPTPNTSHQKPEVENISDNMLTEDSTTQNSSAPTYSRNQFDTSKLQEEQTHDPVISVLIKQLQTSSKTLPFVYKDNLLYRLTTLSRSAKRNTKVIYVPSSMIASLLQAAHDDPMTGAHFSLDRTYNKLKYSYWWPNMKSTIKTYIKACLLCKQYNVSRHKSHGHLRPIDPPERPFLLIGIDYCGPLKRTPRDNLYVLVITDYFTRHVTAVALPNCTAETTAQTLFTEYFCKFGIPAVILSDQGTQFRNQLMDNITNLLGYNHIYSTAYHPQTNGVVERINATFIPQISKLHDAQDNNWDEYLQAVVFAYNTGIHKATQYSPFELLYGRQCRFPIHTRPSSFSFAQPHGYLFHLQKTLSIYHRAARYHIRLQQHRSKLKHDANRRDPHYSIGDQVLVKIHGYRNKLDAKYSLTPKIIIQAQHPIYTVQDEDTLASFRVHVSGIRPILSP